MSIQEYKRLCSAILINRLDDIVKGGPDGEDALQWIYKATNSYLFDFNVVCKSLGLDGRMIQEAVRTNKIKDLLDRFKFLLRESQREKASPALPRHTEYRRRVASGR